ncbi:coiled-coil domain-containing protein 15 [Oryzias latipes]|uniref:Coiled-coil domain containing 15 n=1 Tax=Oryzias latipes TaxID=8090 RepID=H2MH35_ORYLA|nr:coiled-coil domain-containing protein 15 [Oryzias latipes]
MSAKRVRGPAANRRSSRAPVRKNAVNRVPASSRVLAERNPAVVAVGAWVEEGQDFPEHPSALALLTEELQAEKKRINEESLRRFQDEVRRRLAKRAQVCEKGQQLHPNAGVNPERSIQYYQIRPWRLSASEKQRISEGPDEGTSKVRLRLAACRLTQEGETASELPGDRWKISPTRHEVESPMRRTEEEVLGQHECPLVQQKMSGHGHSDQAKSNPDPGFKPTTPLVSWPLTEQQELKKQRQFQFLMHRRLAMSTEREQVKENRQHRKHLQRSARIKAEKEQIRLEEEKRLEEAQQLAEARHNLEERELLILERLQLEEEERAALLQSRKQEERKRGGRFVDALRAQMKERLSQLKLEPPPLCCCASSFWDSHPDTCANNCVFHNNPRAYARALHSTMLSVDLQ